MNTGDTVWLLISAALITYALKFTLGLRPHEIPATGIDALEHGERAYALSVRNGNGEEVYG